MLAQPQPKQKRLTRFMNWIAKKEGTQVEYQEETVTGKAIRIVTDGRLEKRLEEYIMVLELLEEGIHPTTLNNYIDELEDMTKTLHSCISRLSGPYSRAGDSEEFAKMMHGWDKLYHNALSKCQRARMFCGSDDALAKNSDMMTHDEITIKNLHLFFFHVVWPDGFDVLNYSFRDKDVTARSVTLVQTMGPVSNRGEGLASKGKLEEY